MSMTPIARALTQELLVQHRHVCRPGQGIDPCLIAYGDLIGRAGVPIPAKGIGKFLCETAEWCAENDWPPLNALAVNDDTRMPGDNYDLAPGCNLLNWADEVRACINFDGYPEQLQ